VSEFATTRTRVSLDNCNYYGSDLRRPSAYQDNLSNSGKLFALQNKMFIVAVDAQPVSACKSLFKS
jgi:hypothetical protein